MVTKRPRKRKQQSEEKVNNLLKQTLEQFDEEKNQERSIEWHSIQRNEDNEKLVYNNELELKDRLISWKRIREAEEISQSLPAHHFEQPYATIMKQMNEHLGKLLFLLRWSTYKKKDTGESLAVYWPALAMEFNGLYVRLQFYGDDGEAQGTDYWVNVLSQELQPFTDASDKDKALILAPPYIREKFGLKEVFDHYFFLRIDLRYKSFVRTDHTFTLARHRVLKANKFRIGQRVELLDNQYPERVRVAEVKKIRGRRTLVEVSPAYYDPSTDEQAMKEIIEERQFGTDLNWLDEASPLIFHVGWAALSEYRLQTIKSHPYIHHAERIAAKIFEDSRPSYEIEDATMTTTMRQYLRDEKYKGFKVGMKLEFLDVLDDSTLNWLKVGTILRVMPNDYLLIGSDESKDKDLLPLHADSPYIFEAGYGNKYGIPIYDPIEQEAVSPFDWDGYLKKTNSQAAPAELFQQVPPNLDELFPVGSYFEASCHNESFLYFAAKVAAIRGRLIEAHYLYYPDACAELFDYRSGDIFPIGHAEGFGLPLVA